MLDLAHIRALADAATDGPWCVTNSLPDKSLRTEAGWEVCYFPYSDALANMDFIAAARELVPAMADEIERLHEHAHICSDLLDANEALGHSLTSARGEIERLRDLLGREQMNRAADRKRANEAARLSAAALDEANDLRRTIADLHEKIYHAVVEWQDGGGTEREAQ